MPAIRALALASVLGGSGHPVAQDTARLSRLIALEDARPADLNALAPLLEALASSDPLVVRIAARGLGRQERPELIDRLARLLDHSSPAVRAEVINAIGQSSLDSRAEDAGRLLEARLLEEADPAVRGVLLRTLGRLPFEGEAQRRHIEQLLVRGSEGNERSAELLAGASHGLHSLYRGAGSEVRPSAEAIGRLEQLLDRRQPPLVRRLAMAALVVSQRADPGALGAALEDPEPEVRRLALQAAANQAGLPAQEQMVRRGLSDPDPKVRYEALRAFAARPGPGEGCGPVLAALDDSSRHTSLLAIDLLGGCGSAGVPRLRQIAGMAVTQATWHAPAHALVALARVRPATADSLIAACLNAPVWWLRMYAARAAEATGNDAALERLARDRHPNVRDAAIDALRKRRGHAADPLYLEALQASDYQLVRTVALALEGSPHPGAAQAVLEALHRMSREQSETSRDTRVALLTTLGTVGGPALAPALRDFLSDFDPVVAAQAAELSRRWGESVPAPTPKPLSPLPAPSWSDLERLNRTSVVFVMRGGGRVTVRLHPFDAPTNAARLAAMARAGQFDGLTFHRVAPNFVVQGGSPGANEYAGQARFTRDERSLLHHARGTVGLSTRGRDTGDGQIFINLVDNWRLDHTYTLLGEVTAGMDIVESMLEGAVIERVLIVEHPHGR